MKVLQKVLAVVCAIAVTGTMTVPSSMVGLLAHAEDIQSEIGSEEQSNEENPDDIQSVGDSEEASDFEDTISALTDEEQPMSGQCGENVYWALDDEGTLTISGTGEMYDYSHSPWYWDYNDDIKSAIVSDGVTSIGESSFWGCNNLKSITMPDSVIRICDEAFYYCNSLTSVTIPDSVTSIGDYAFEYCKGLTSVAIPNGVRSIGNGAFMGCEKLVNAEISKSVTSIGDFAFYTCSSLISINVDDDNCEYSSDNGVLFNKDATELICFPSCNAQTSYTIPNGVLTLKERSFFSCSNLNSLVISNSVTSIEKACFAGCSSLNSVVISNNIASIEEETFNCCNSLISIEIPDGVTYIGNDAFSGCHKLESVIMPSSVTCIGDYAFYWCFPLETVIIPNGVTHIGAWAFTGCGLSTVTLYNSIKSIGYNAFNTLGYIDDVFFFGTKEQWEEIEIDNRNGNLTDANIHFNSNGPDNAKVGELTVSNGSSLDNVLFYVKPYFSIELGLTANKINKENIFLMRYDDDSIINTIPFDEDINLNEFGYYVDDYGILLIDYLKAEDAVRSLENNTKYYFDLQNITVDGVNIFTQQESKQNFSFTTGFTVFKGIQTFNFVNEKNSFWNEAYGQSYYMTSAFYINEIMTSDNKNIRNSVTRFLKWKKWGGSCNGMSAVMMLQNAGKMNGALNEHQQNYETIGDYPTPLSTKDIPYGSCDLINYFQALATIKDGRKESNDVETINYIIDRASRIENFEDVFQLSYAYYDENAKKKFGHSVNVLGRVGDSNQLYVYDNMYDEILIYELSVYQTPSLINNTKVHLNKKIINISSSQASYDIDHISYSTISDYTKYIPDMLKNKTKIHTAPNLPFSIKNTWQQIMGLNEMGDVEGTLVPDDVSYLASGENPADIIITLPGDDYYEISPVDGKLDYDILNENMYYAVKAENAEKSIVDAKEGIQLINNIGKFELTVTSDNDTYDMFDVSGSGNGNFICKYTDDGIVVIGDADDVSVTIHKGLDDNTYDLPDNVDKFIVTETDSTPAILIDTDNDGDFETNIIKPTITIPDNVTVTTALEKILKNGDEINEGDVLHIEAIIPDGKKLISLTVNGAAIENGATYTVGTESVVIAVSFDDITDLPAEKIKITIPENVVVTKNGIAVNNGDEISEGDVLSIKADIPSGYRLSSLTVNGKSIANGDTYTVGKENVIIAVILERLTNDNPNEPDTPNRPDDNSKPDINTNQPFIISNSDKIGWGSILDELNISSDKTVMIDMNGTTVLPANILQVIKDNNIKLMLKMDDRVSWSIDGKDVERIDRDIDLKVIIGADNIPDEAIKKFVGERKYLTLSIKHNGDLGFSAFLVINVGEQYSNEPATLYWFNDNAFKLEDSCKVQYGMAVLKFTHASDWVIAFGEAEDHANSNAPSHDSSSDDTSHPIDARPNETKPDESNNSKPTTTEPGNSSDDEKDNPHTGGSRVSLATFLTLITSAALCLITHKQKR